MLASLTPSPDLLYVRACFAENLRIAYSIGGPRNLAVTGHEGAVSLAFGDPDVASGYRAALDSRTTTVTGTRSTRRWLCSRCTSPRTGQTEMAATLVGYLDTHGHHAWHTPLEEARAVITDEATEKIRALGAAMDGPAAVDLALRTLDSLTSLMSRRAQAMAWSSYFVKAVRLHPMSSAVPWPTEVHTIGNPIRAPRHVSAIATPATTVAQLADGGGAEWRTTSHHARRPGAPKSTGTPLRPSVIYRRVSGATERRRRLFGSGVVRTSCACWVAAQRSAHAVAPPISLPHRGGSTFSCRRSRERPSRSSERRHHSDQSEVAGGADD